MRSVNDGSLNELEASYFRKSAQPYRSRVALLMNDFIRQYGKHCGGPAEHVLTLLIRDPWDGPHADQSVWGEWLDFYWEDAIDEGDQQMMDAAALAALFEKCSREQLKRLSHSYQFMPWGDATGGEADE